MLFVSLTPLVSYLFFLLKLFSSQSLTTVQVFSMLHPQAFILLFRHLRQVHTHIVIITYGWRIPKLKTDTHTLWTTDWWYCLTMGHIHQKTTQASLGNNMNRIFLIYSNKLFISPVISISAGDIILYSDDKKIYSFFLLSSKASKFLLSHHLRSFPGKNWD